jgi:L-2-hydroxycarboxylate dehydrogenase (NAD+)
MSFPVCQHKKPCFYFQVIRPEALSGGAFASGLSHGSEHCLLPGELEARWAKKCARNNGLLFSRHEIRQLNQIATACGEPDLEVSAFPQSDMT